MSTIKDFLKKILPPPVSTFNREIGIVKKRLDTLSAENAELTETLNRQNTLLQEDAVLFHSLETQLQKFDELQQQLDRLGADLQFIAKIHPLMGCQQTVSIGKEQIAQYRGCQTHQIKNIEVQVSRQVSVDQPGKSGGKNQS